MEQLTEQLFDAIVNNDINEALLLISQGANVNAINPRKTNRQTPLHTACLEQNKEMVQMLLDNGADIENENDWSSRPLHVVSDRGYVDMVELLLQNGAKINAVNGKKNTALHIACWEDNIKVVSLLLDNDADASIKNENGETCVDIAHRMGRKHILDLLYSYA